MSEQRNSAGQEIGFLEKLSIEELEALLKTSGNPNDVEAFFDAVIKEVVKREEKESTGRLPDVDTAWEDLQTRCEILDKITSLSGSAGNTNENELRTDEIPPKKGSTHKFGRSFLPSAAKLAAIVVLTLLLTFSMMIGVQAFGIDMFGALARWTSDTFHFETQPSMNEPQNDLYDSVRALLDVNGLLGEYAPRWYPEGSKITKSVLQDDEFRLNLQVSFSAPDNKQFYIRVDQYSNSQYIDKFISEKDANFFEEYLSHSKLFYLFSNNEYMMGIWSNGKTVLNIRGNLTVEELKSIIDSIGG